MLTKDRNINICLLRLKINSPRQGIISYKYPIILYTDGPHSQSDFSSILTWVRRCTNIPFTVNLKHHSVYVMHCDPTTIGACMPSTCCLHQPTWKITLVYFCGNVRYHWSNTIGVFMLPRTGSGKPLLNPMITYYDMHPLEQTSARL